jgi:hypothetical protein
MCSEIRTLKGNIKLLVGSSLKRKDNGSKVLTVVAYSLKAVEREGSCEVAHSLRAVKKEAFCKVLQDIKAVNKDALSLELKTEGFNTTIFKV